MVEDKNEFGLIVAGFARTISVASVESASYHWMMDNIDKFNERIIEQSTKGFRRLAISVPNEYVGFVTRYFCSAKYLIDKNIANETNGFTVMVIKW